MIRRERHVLSLLGVGAVLVLFVSCGGCAYSNELALDGWAAVDSVESKVGYTAAREGYSFFRIEFQVKNVSTAIRFLNTGAMQLRDEDGFLYPCSFPVIEELQATYVLLLPGEAFCYALSFEAPVGTVPASLVINMRPWDDIESQRVSIQPEAPREYLRQGAPCLDVADSAQLLGLRWAIDSLTFGSEGETRLELVLLVENETDSVVDLVGSSMYVLLADDFGHISGPPFDLWQRLPLDFRPGEFARLRVSFSLEELQIPLYLFLKTGTFLREAAISAWLLPGD